jgi:hypothetical protein
MGNFDKNLSTHRCSEVTTREEKVRKDDGDSSGYETESRDKIGMSLATFEDA